jgi:hypothetical protein
MDIIKYVRGTSILYKAYHDKNLAKPIGTLQNSRIKKHDGGKSITQRIKEDVFIF